MNALDWSGWSVKLRKMFNLNDSRWGRGDKPAESSQPEQSPEGEGAAPPKQPNDNGRKGGPNSGPPDLDELWRDFNRKLGGLFGKSPQPPRGAGWGKAAAS